MLNLIKEEGKTKEEVISKIEKQYNITVDDCFMKEEYIEGKLFKSAKYIISVITKDEIKKYLKTVIENISNLMNFRIDSEIIERDSVFHITLISDNNAILIGREGKNLNSLQLLLKQSIRKQTNMDIKINLDVANYKLKKLKNIENEIKHIAEEVLNSKIQVSLDPMNSYERRLVHNLINEYENLETESIGEGKDRHIIIRYIGEA